LPLLPVRMVNEFSYCPRLAYLEWVQGEWAESADTVEGKYLHRRVDKTAGNLPAPDELDDEEKIHARSVTLSSKQKGQCRLIPQLDTGKAGIQLKIRSPGTPYVSHPPLVTCRGDRLFPGHLAWTAR